MLDMSIIIFSILITLGIGIWKSMGVKSGEDYIVAGRQMGLFLLVSTFVMTEFNTTTLVAYTRFGYTAGIYGSMIVLSLLCSYPAYGFLFAKRWKRINLISVTDFFDQRYGRTMKRATAILFMISLLFFSATYLKALARIFAVGLNISEFWTAVLLYIIVFLLTFWGGLVSVAWSNVVGFIISLTCIPLLLVYCWKNGGGMEGLANVYDPKYLSWHTFSMWNDPNLPFFLVVGVSCGTLINGQLYPWAAQRMFAAKDERTAYLGVYISALCIFLLFLIPNIAVSFVRTKFQNLTDPEQALGYAIWHLLPIGARGLLLAVIFSVCQTTVSAVWNNAASLFAYDGYQGFFNPNATSDDLLRISRYSVIFLCIFSFIVSLYLRGILDALYLAAGFRICLNFACWAGFLWWRTSQRAVLITAALGIIGILSIRFAIGGDLWVAHVNSWGNLLFFALGIVFVYLLPSLPEEILLKRKFFQTVGNPWIGKKYVGI